MSEKNKSRRDDRIQPLTFKIFLYIVFPRSGLHRLLKTKQNKTPDKANIKNAKYMKTDHAFHRGTPNSMQSWAFTN